MIAVIFHAALPQNIPLSFRFENAETPVFIDLFRFAALKPFFLKKIKLVAVFLWKYKYRPLNVAKRNDIYKKKEGVETPPNN